MDDPHEEEDSSDLVHDIDFMDSQPTAKEQQMVRILSLRVGEPPSPFQGSIPSGHGIWSFTREKLKQESSTKMRVKTPDFRKHHSIAIDIIVSCLENARGFWLCHGVLVPLALGLLVEALVAISVCSLFHVIFTCFQLTIPCRYVNLTHCYETNLDAPSQQKTLRMASSPMQGLGY